MTCCYDDNFLLSTDQLGPTTNALALEGNGGFRFTKQFFQEFRISKEMNMAIFSFWPILASTRYGIRPIFWGGVDLHLKSTYRLRQTDVHNNGKAFL